jgi:hypothetical protein
LTITHILMTKYSPARVLYALGAVIYSVLGLLEFMWNVRLYDGLTSKDFGTQLMMGYLFIRGILLAPFQLWAHGSLMWSMRFYTDAADSITTLIGGGDLNNGIKKWYRFTFVCTLAIGLMCVFGVAVLMIVPTVEPVFYTLEILSLEVIGSIFIARLVGLFTFRTRDMFYLAWSTRQADNTSNV